MNFGALFRNLTPVVKNLLIINVLVFVGHYALYLTSDKTINVEQLFALRYVAHPDFQPYTFVTSMFTHGGLFHLAMNMLTLMFMGPRIEYELGAKKFLILYFAAGLGGGVLASLATGVECFINSGSWVLETLDANNDGVPEALVDGTLRAYWWRVVGASGAIFGLFAAYFVYYPDTKVNLMLIPIPIKVRNLFLFLVGVSVVFGLVGLFNPDGTGGISHWGHLGGGLMGLLIVRYWSKNRYRVK